MWNLSDDDSFSTQLEGKKLKNRGARVFGKDGGAYKSEPQLEIDKDAPALMEQVEIEEGQEYFTDRELSKENKQEREERLKREMAAARKQGQELQKDQQRQQLQVGENSLKPNERLGEIEQGMLESRNKGRKTISTQFKQHNQPIEELQAKADNRTKKTDVAIVGALVGDNVNGMQAAENKPDDKSIPAKLLPDIRGKEAGAELGF